MQYKNYTDTDVINKSKEVYSIAGLLKALNLKVAGGNYANIKRKLQKLNVNTKHWKGFGWSKDQQLKDWKDYSKVAYIKRHLLKERKHRCERCKRVTWLKQRIPLEIHHLDKDRTNNSVANLLLVCPNCHKLFH